jgi:hypothetical protein
MLNKKLPEFLTELEKTVLSFLLQEDSVENRILGEQLTSCSLESREHNGYGFFTNFNVDEAAPRCAKENFELGDVSVVLSGQLCGFILFVRAGKIDFLEGFPLGGDEWPSPEKIQKVSRFQSC